MKKIVWFITLFLCFSGTAFSLTPPPNLSWTPLNSIASKATILEGGQAAEFDIRRISSAPKTDVGSHGFAYLLSSPILLPEKWNRVVLSGRWWFPGKGRSNYPEMTMFVMGKYPNLEHGVRQGSRELTDYLMVSYDTWHRKIKFADRGVGSSGKTVRGDRQIPRTPVEFRIVIQRDPATGSVSWDFDEKRGGTWQSLHHEENTGIFDGTNKDSIYWKIGAWTTWHKPIASTIRFDRLAYRVYVEEQKGTEEYKEDTQEASGSSGITLEQGSANLLRRGRKIRMDRHILIEPGDVIVTEGRGETLLRLLDGSVLRLGSGSRFRMDRLYGHCGMGQICGGTLLEGTLRLLFHSGKEGWWIRIADALIRLSDAEVLFRLLDGRKEIGCLSGLIVIEIGGKRYELHGGELLRFRNGHWEIILLETEDEMLPKTFSECMKFVPIMPGATNASRYPVGGGTTIRNEDTLHSYLVHASVSKVMEYYRTHPPKGSGWRLKEKNHLLTWSNGIMQVVIGIGPTGVDTITNIYFHYCGRALESRGSAEEKHRRNDLEGTKSGEKEYPRERGREHYDQLDGLGNPELRSCLKIVPHPSGFIRLNGRSSMLQKSIADTGWQEESYRGSEDAVFVYDFFRQYLPSQARKISVAAPDDHLHAYIGWELPKEGGRILYRVWVMPEMTGKSTIDIGCKWERQ
jgi:hypothetical protein